MRRNQDPLVFLGIGKKIEEGLVITDEDLSSFKPNPDFILEGFIPQDIYVMKHLFANSIIGVCSGRKSWKTLKNYMKKERFGDYEIDGFGKAVCLIMQMIVKFILKVEFLSINTEVKNLEKKTLIFG